MSKKRAVTFADSITRLGATTPERAIDVHHNYIWRPAARIYTHLTGETKAGLADVNLLIIVLSTNKVITAVAL